MDRVRDNLREAMVARSRHEIAGFLDGLELVGPGLVPIDEWVPGGPAPRPPLAEPLYVAVGRKPWRRVAGSAARESHVDEEPAAHPAWSGRDRQLRA